MHKKLYPESGVELNPFISKNYDRMMNIGSAGFYSRFIKKVIAQMKIDKDDHILDLGCGTGRNSKLMTKYLGENGRITGLDISPEMEQQFKENFKDDERVTFKNQRIDIPFDLGEKFDKVFISFVIHGFPHEVRFEVIKNAYNHLKPGGAFFILDFAEFDMDKMPALYRFIFKKVECVYAFDFIKRDWKEILSGYGFGGFEEHHYMKKYVRLLKAVKR
ncbi:MAG: class I SAM-dependent methyltransferase [Chlorobi bacterium]|nr:class I SAM-dependent methyltransferase [Chlorobiota bacterium]